jgi:hypothetical protein
MVAVAEPILLTIGPVREATDREICRECVPVRVVQDGAGLLLDRHRSGGVVVDGFKVAADVGGTR